MSINKYHSLLILFIVLTIIKSEDVQGKQGRPINNDFPQEIPNDKLYEMTDANFNYFLHRKEFKWFILFYLKTCGHCAKARKVISSLYQTALDPTLRFGQIEISTNIMTSIRFNSTQVPYMVIIQDDMMFEFKKYHNEPNLKEFINNEKVAEEAVAIPPQPKFIYVAWVMLRDGIISARMSLQTFLNKKGYKIELKTYHLIIVLLAMLGLCILCQCWCINKCCQMDDFEEYLRQQNEELRKNKQEMKEVIQEEAEEKKDENVVTEEEKKRNEESIKEQKDESSKVKKKKKKEKEKEKENKKEDEYPNPQEGKEKPELKKD